MTRVKPLPIGLDGRQWLQFHLCQLYQPLPWWVRLPRHLQMFIVSQNFQKSAIFFWGWNVCPIPRLQRIKLTFLSLFVKKTLSHNSGVDQKIKKSSVQKKNSWNQINQFHEILFWPNSIFCNFKNCPKINFWAEDKTAKNAIS